MNATVVQTKTVSLFFKKENTHMQGRALAAQRTSILKQNKTRHRMGRWHLCALLGGKAGGLTQQALQNKQEHSGAMRPATGTEVN